ncbi:transposase [Mycolicibacterium gilvum]|uniref:transposase n=1 Tax=Mycolicibacterium gilvum TaxID=1804 RepID=UPI00404633E2
MGARPALADKLPKVADHLESARPDLLAFTNFPKQIWRQIWSNNPLSVNRPSYDTTVDAA